MNEPKGKILVVDDDRNILHVIKLRLVSDGYHVTMTTAPEEALSHVVRAGILNKLRKGKDARKSAIEACRLGNKEFEPVDMKKSEYIKLSEQASQLAASSQFAQAAPIALQMIAAHPEDAVPYNVVGLALFSGVRYLLYYDIVYVRTVRLCKYIEYLVITGA